jgi:hypothetical protein
MFDKGRITPVGPIIFEAPVTPFDLFMTAQQAPENEREAWEGFAADLATIRELPVTEAAPPLIF